MQFLGLQTQSLAPTMQDEDVFALHCLVFVLYVQALQFPSLKHFRTQAPSELTISGPTALFPRQMAPTLCSQPMMNKDKIIKLPLMSP